MRIHVDTAIVIRAPSDYLAALYMDYAHWSRLFPATIRGVRLVRQEEDAITVEVDHRTAGPVINIIKQVAADEIVLKEFKPKFDARFLNRFEPIVGGSRYAVIADVYLKMPYALLTPFLGWYVRRTIRRFVLEPMRTYAERTHSHAAAWHATSPS